MSALFADEQLAEYLAQPSAPPGTPDISALRAGIAQRARMRAPGPEMQAVRDWRIGHVNCRLYRPLAGPVPVVVYLHGGGWTVGSLDSHDRACRRLAAGAGASVLAVDYRLAPEHPWPASVDDTAAVLQWVATAPAQLDHEGAVAVAGDSAGGTLAALSCLRLRDECPAALPYQQVLIYANTDLAGDHPSMHEKANGFGLDVDTVRFFNSQWVPDKTRWSHPGVSPLHAPDLRGLPPALIVTAEHDVLRDEGEAYAHRLRQAGVDVRLRCEPGLVHNFMLLDEISPACAAAADRVAADLRTSLRRGHQREIPRYEPR
jgi:acetyl esterase